LKVLVTGAGGFVGPHLVKELIQAGHEVGAVDRDPLCSQKLEGACLFQADLLNEKAVDGVLVGFRPDSIIHLAGWSHVGRSWHEPAMALRLNVVATVELYQEFSRQLGDRKGRFLFASSADVYADTTPDKLPYTEQSEVIPTSPYAVSKYAAEMALGVMRSDSSADVLIARPFNHIGPGQSPQFVCPSFAQQIAEIEAGERDVLRHGNLGTKRDFLDVRDVVRAYRLILEQGNDGDTFVIASGKSQTIESLVHQMFELAGIAPRMEPNPELMRPHDPPERCGSPALLNKVTGWTSEYTLDKTLLDILNEARERVKNKAK
jgi:GDP-4-dehydro-6-deoxy-D-mannose reductase